MKIVADTNIIVRFVVDDDIQQMNAVHKLLKNCEEVIIPTHVFCEFFWVLSTVYRVKHSVILGEIELLIKSAKVNFNEDEVEAGLSMMHKGGDFADGVNAYTGRKMGGGKVVFATFDRKAIRLLSEQGIATLLPE